MSVKSGMLVGFVPDRLRESYDTKFFVGGMMGVPITPSVLVRPSIGYGQLAYDAAPFVEEHRGDRTIVMVRGGDYRALFAGVDLLLGFHRPAMVAVYGLAGAGYYRGTVEDFTVLAIEGTENIAGASNAGVMLKGGAGVRIHLNDRLGGLLEGELVYGMMDSTHLVFPISLGLFLNM